MTEAQPNPHPENEPNPSPYDHCIEKMKEFVLARTAIRPLYVPPDSIDTDRQGPPYQGYARVGSVMIEDVAAEIPGTPIMYDVHIFAQESVDRGSPSARLVKALPALGSVEYTDFLDSQRVRRTVVSEQQRVRLREYLAPEEVELLARQLVTLGPLERAL